MQTHLHQYIRKPSFVKLIAKSLAIRIDKNYTLEKGESDFETQYHTKNGHRAGLQTA
jgi:hypothetical protein